MWPWLAANIGLPIIEWLLSVGVQDLINYWNKQKQANADKTAAALAAAAYQKIIDDPNSTEQERKDAETALLNS